MHFEPDRIYAFPSAAFPLDNPDLLKQYKQLAHKEQCQSSLNETK